MGIAFCSRKLNCRLLEIPKCGVTSTKAALLKSDGYDIYGLDGNAIHAHPHWQMCFYIKNDMDFVFTICRHPLSRLFSAYKEKVLTGKIKILQPSCWLNKNSTLEDCIDWLISENPKQIDSHFRKQSLILQGKPKPNMMLRFENLAKEWRVLQERIKIADLPHYNKSGASQHWKENFTKKCKSKAEEYYKEDLIRFNYI